MTEPVSTLAPDVILALGEQVVQAAHDFAQALSETDQFQAWEQAAWVLKQDKASQAMGQKLQARQQELQPLLMLGAATVTQLTELEQLRSEYLALPTVVAYVVADAALRELCQAANAVLSRMVGLDFAANAGSGCCG